MLDDERLCDVTFLNQTIQILMNALKLLIAALRHVPIYMVVTYVLVTQAIDYSLMVAYVKVCFIISFMFSNNKKTLYIRYLSQILMNVLRIWVTVVKI